MGCLLKQGGGLYPRLRIGAVLLAAEAGRRMHGVPKALIRLQGVPLVCRQLVALSGAGVDEVVIVTGPAREAVEQHVRSFSVRLAHDERFAQGPESSVRVGLAALEGPFDAVLVLPAHMPLLGANDLIELIGAFKKRPAGHAVRPVVDGRAGEPLLLDAIAHRRLLEGDWDAALVHRHETANTRFITDLDTLDDLESLARRTGWRLELPEMEAAT
jgi:molybdenum cofactor cytidylyltransferase